MARNIVDLVYAAAAAHPDRVATREWVGMGWSDRTYAALVTDVEAVAARLLVAGIAAGDRIALFSANRPMWTVVDLAVLAIGAVSVPIHQTSTPDQARLVLADSGARWVVCGSDLEAERVREVADELPGLERIVVLDRENIAEEASGRTAEVAERRAAVGPDHLATIVYTSGTTGRPKGVMLTHGAFLTEIHAVRETFSIDENDSSLCFLPLSHALERAWTWVVLSSGAMNVYVTDTRTIVAMMARSRTSMMVMVPKVFETVMKSAREQASSPYARQLFDWAVQTGLEAQHAGPDRLRTDRSLRWRLALADRLVLGKVRRALGGQKKLLVAGGAPLRTEVEEFFWACGMLIYTGYGMTEAAPLMTFNHPGEVRFGSVGRAMAGGEVRVAPVPGLDVAVGDGEVEYRGSNVMVGYWHDEASTAEVFDDGWLRTGDVGHFDIDGYLVITDRLKDIIVTQQGKNIAPAPIEEQLGTDPMIAHAVLVGDDRPCVTVLISPNVPELEAWAEAHEIAYASSEELVGHPALLEELRRRVEQVSARLPHQEKIRDLRLVPGGFSMENGLLTPTLKVRRRAVEKRFGHVVDEMYERIAAARKAAKEAAAHLRHEQRQESVSRE